MYKITNITNLLGKRDFKFNSNINIDYVDGLLKKTMVVKPGDNVVLSIDSLPLSVHRLRVKNLVTVMEIGEAEKKELIAKNQKPIPKPIENTKKNISTKKTNTSTKITNTPTKKTNKDRDDSYLVVPK